MREGYLDSKNSAFVEDGVAGKGFPDHGETLCDGSIYSRYAHAGQLQSLQRAERDGSRITVEL